MKRIPTQKRSHSTTRVLVLGGIIVMIAVVLISILGSARSANGVSGADPNNATLVAEGRLVYTARCASCHGANLEGQPNWQQPLADGTMPAPPHDASGHTWHHDDQSLFTTVKYGGQATAPAGYRSAMPAFGNVLSDREIWAVLAYIKSTWPPEIQAVQRQGHQ